MRRLLEGRRVDNEIEAELKKAKRAAGPDGDVDDAMGKTMPRESDEQLLEELDSQIQEEKGAAPA